MLNGQLSHLAARWVALTEGPLGWTGMPRLALWLCVPAVLAGVFAVVSQVIRGVAHPTEPEASAVASVIALLVFLLTSLGVLTTPVGAFLVLLVSLRRRWRLHVVVVLWVVVAGAMAMLVPSLEAALGNWLTYFGGLRR